MRSPHFYGLATSSIKPSSTQSSIVNLILKKKYLNVFGFNGPENVCGVFDQFGYLENVVYFVNELLF